MTDPTIETAAAQAIYYASEGSISPQVFTCDESDAVAEFLERYLGPGPADEWRRDHAAGDEPGDRHYLGDPR